jgi:hypothetical protein
MSHNQIKVAGIVSNEILQVATVHLVVALHAVAELVLERQRVLWIHDGVVPADEQGNRDTKLLHLLNIQLRWGDLSINPLVHDTSIVIVLELRLAVDLVPMLPAFDRGTSWVVAEEGAEAVEVDGLESLGGDEGDTDLA